MMRSYLLRIAVGCAAASVVSTAAIGQSLSPGAEVLGQPIAVTSNGVTNTVILNPGGQLQIMTPGGSAVSGTWTAANGQLCLGVGGAQECVPYNAPFQAGQPQTLTSSCNVSETWLAESTNAPPTQGAAPERGR